MAFFLSVGIASTPAAATVYRVGDDGILRSERFGKPTEFLPSASDGTAAPELAPDVSALAITTVTEPNVPLAFRQYVLSAARSADLSPRFLAAVATQESRWRAGAASPKGALGLTQLMPATARALAVDPRDPQENLAGGARYLRALIDRFDGNLERALAAYNAGPGRVARASGIPAIPETRAYVTTIVDGLGGTILSQGRP